LSCGRGGSLKKLEPRDTQTRVKHEVLERYFSAWGRIITYGLRGHADRAARAGRPFIARFVYVDAFSSCGRYTGDRGDILLGKDVSEVWGSPIIGLKALDRLHDYAAENLPSGTTVITNAILVEKSASSFARLRESLQLAGYGERVKEHRDFAQLGNREIAAVNDDFLRVANDVLSFTQSPTFSFYLLDPYGPLGIPFWLVQNVAAQRGTDVIINFPYQDLHRKAGYGKYGAGDLPRGARKVIDNYTAAFGESEDAWLTIWNENIELGSADAEQAVVSHYRERLRTIDPGIAVKLVPLRFPDRERTMFYLFLTTKDPTGALVLNRIVYDARLDEFLLRDEFAIAKIADRIRTVEESQGILELFPVEETVAPPATPVQPDRDLDLSDLAERIMSIFAGTSTTIRDIYRAFVDSNVFPDDIGKALTVLKKKKVASYERRDSINDVVSFAKGPSDDAASAPRS